MVASKVLRFILLTALISVGVASAQEPHQHQHDATEKLGQVSFTISCNPAAQQKFNRALALLHSFQYVEAEQAFTEIRASDPGCAMAYWGIAMSNYHPIWAPPTPAELEKGRAAVAKAVSIGGKSERENGYIAAIEIFYKDSDKLDHRARSLAYEKAMERLQYRYRKDHEATIFYALSLLGTAIPTDKNYTNQKKAAELLNKVMLDEPEHPGIAHYIIHSFDYPQLARLALPAARRYAGIAPSSAHALHMPSHIFTRLGVWPDSIQSNLASAAAAKQQVAQVQPGTASKDQLHAMDYLIYAYLQGAQDDQAKRVLDEALAYSEADQSVFQVAYAWAAIPARFALERRRWKEAASLTLHPAKFTWERFRFAEANIYFARAIGAARSGDTAVALQEIKRLASIQAGIGGAKTDYDWARQVQIQHHAARAWLAQAEGKSGEAERLLRAAAELEDSTDKHPVTPGAILPAREMLGDLLLELKQPAQALKEYEAVLQTAPNRFNSLYGAGHAAELAGNRQKARAYYRKLTTICSHTTGQRSELQLAKAYLAKK